MSDDMHFQHADYVEIRRTVAAAEDSGAGVVTAGGPELLAGMARAVDHGLPWSTPRRAEDE